MSLKNEMRDATEKEQNSIDKYIDSISTDTGVNFYNLSLEQKWIPCSEDSPKSSGEYLVTVKWPSDEYSIDVYEYNVSHKEWNDGESFCGEQAVAWMKLPELYKGGQ